MRKQTKAYLEEKGFDQNQYKSVALYNKEGKYFAIPFEWKELLGEDVISGRLPLSLRLSRLNISLNKFKKYCSQSEEFNTWLSTLNQRSVARSKYLEGNPEQIERLKEILRNQSFTKQQKHDFAVNSMSEEIRAKMKSSLRATLDERREEIIDKRTRTLLTKYGVKVSMRVPGAREKAEQTNLERYGLRNHAMISKEEIMQRLKAIGITPINEIEDLSEGKEHNAICDICGKQFTFHFSSTRPTMCPFCNKKSTELERKITIFISQFTKVVPHYRVLGAKEIDIYLPYKNIGIEINGALTHNSGFTPFSGRPKDQYYHRDKSEQAKELGIKLYHVWEHWDEQKVFNFINAIIGNTINIYARSLKVNESPDKNKVLKFLNDNHLHGSKFYSFAISLENENGDIIQVMTFIQKANTLELSRFATKAGIRVIGGASRIFAKVKTKVIEKGINEIKSYAYRDLTPFPEDSVYSRLGFKLEKDTGPMLFFYVYKTLKLKDSTVIKSGVYQRENFMKAKLEKFNGTKIKDKEFKFDSTITAEDNLAKLGIYPIYNSGCWKFIYNI